MSSSLSGKKRRRYSSYPGYLRRNKADQEDRRDALKTTYFWLAVFFFLCTLSWLVWFFSEAPFPYYRVHAGDDIAAVARRFSVDPNRLIHLNKLHEEDRLPPGKLLLIPQTATPGMTYIVRSKNETLSEVSELFNVSQADLIKFNDLDSPILHKGDLLYLTQNRPDEYTVAPGDTLMSIAQRFQLSENQLLQYNALNSASVQSGQVLYLYNHINVDFRHLPVEVRYQKKTSSRLALLKDKAADLAKKIPRQIKEKPKTEEKFSDSTNEEQIQKQRAHTVSSPPMMSLPVPNYAELSQSPVFQDLQMAANLFAIFDQEVRNMPPLGHELSGYSIVIDPGHGGLDPGAIVKTRVNGKEIYLVEDEFNYDISLRLYRLLKRYGANVLLTVLSPNNVIREEEDGPEFANEKNEVYNDIKLDFRPVGGREGNKERIKIGEKFLKNTPKEKRIWISIHHDSSPHSPAGLVAVHTEAGTETYDLAKLIIKEQGRGRIMSDTYFVLEDNPAPAAVLLEVRNPAIGEQSYMLSPMTREQDATTICRAVLAYVAGKNQPRHSIDPPVYRQSAY